MVDWLEQQKCQVVEIDTDGIYFIPKANTTAAKLEQGLRKDVLPDGIDIEFDTSFAAMFSYKSKNYALLSKAGDLVIKGGALKSRGLERFQRLFLQQLLRFLIEEQPDKVDALCQQYAEAIENRQWEVSMFAKTDTLQESLTKYQDKIAASSRNRAAAYELALASGRNYQPGDQISYYVTGTRKRVAVYESCKLASDWDPDDRDENTAYYLGKLDDLIKKFKEFLP